MKRFTFVQPPHVYYYTHIYTHSRIRVNPFIRRKPNDSIILSVVQKNSHLTDIVNSVSSPHEINVGEETPNRQTTLDNQPIDSGNVIRVWYCRVLEERVGRRWIVRVSDDALMDSVCGWLCDCGFWTFGDDYWHHPIFSRIKGKIRCGRILGCQR